MVAGDHDHPDARLVALGDGLGGRGPQGIAQAQQPQELEVEIMLAQGQVSLVQPGGGHPQGAQSLPAHFHDSLFHLGGGPLVQVAKVGHRLGRALGGDDELLAMVRAPDMGQSQQLVAEGVLPHQPPVIVPVLALAQPLLPRLADGPLHGVHRVPLAGQHPELQQAVEVLGQVIRAAGVQGALQAIGPQYGQGHAVFGEGAGLVGA